MAVAYASVSTSAFETLASGGTKSITKPSGLAVGDIMVAHLSGVIAGGSNGNFNTPSGWTSLVNQNQASDANSEARLAVFYKVADSSDVAAGSFDFVTNTATMMVGGAIYRITGGAIVTGAINQDTGDSTPEFPNTVTPDANSLLLFLTTCADAGQASGSVSSYSIATSNPSWTERYDFSGDISSRRGVMAGATASRPEATATGDSTCTYSAHSQNSEGAMVAISPAISVTVSPSVIDVTASVQDPTVAAGATVSPSVIDVTASVQAPVVSSPTPDWINQDKSSEGTTTNLDKS